MAVETGTASDRDDLFAKLITFLTTTMTPVGERWVVEKTQIVDGETEYYLRGPGLGGVDNIYVNIRTETSEAWKVFNLRFSGATSFDTLQDFDDQPNATPTSVSSGRTYGPTLVCPIQPMDYHFIASGRRFIIIINSAEYVASAYCGFILPYASTAEYPYPLLISATSQYSFANLMFIKPSALSTSNDESYSIMQFFDAFYTSTTLGSASWLHTHMSNWLSVQGSSYGSSLGPTSDSEIVASWPWSSNLENYSTRITKAPATNKDFSYSLIPGVLFWSLKSSSPTNITAQQLANMAVYGEYDGVYYVPNFDIQQLDTFTINSDDYLVIKSPFRSEFSNAGAVRLT